MGGAHLSQRGRRPRRRRRRYRSVSVLASWALVGLLVGLLVVPATHRTEPIRVLTVLTGSMVPTLGVGALVLSRVVAVEDLKTGDIVTFPDPTNGRLITHRVQSMLWRGQTVDMVTRGDANEVGEQWSTRRGAQLGLVMLEVPKAGYAVGALGTRAGKLAATGGAMLLGVWALVLIWRKPSDA